METMTPDAQSRPGSTRELAAWPLAGRLMDAGDRSAILRRTVQLQVIPQLLQRCPNRKVAAASVERLAALALETSVGPVMDYVTELLEDSMAAEAIFVDLLAPAARLLGQYWVDDLCTFADVTIGTGHLQSAMRAVRPAFLRHAAPARPDAPRVLLLPQPGEQHDFGVRMLSAFFSRAGWDVWADDDATSAVAHDWFDVVGISVSHDAMLSATGRTVAALRAASRNRHLIILVGGLPFALDPSLADGVGADGTAADGGAAVRLATSLLPGRGSDDTRPPDRDSSA